MGNLKQIKKNQSKESFQMSKILAIFTICILLTMSTSIVEFTKWGVNKARGRSRLLSKSQFGCGPGQQPDTSRNCTCDGGNYNCPEIDVTGSGQVYNIDRLAQPYYERRAQANEVGRRAQVKEGVR